MRKLRFVCAGGWHTHAFDFPLDRAVKKAPHIEKEFVAVWDNDPIRGKQWAEALNCDLVENYDDLIRLPDIDGILITCETTKHEELIVKAANAGINIFVEKAMTVSNESAYRIRDAVKRSKVKFTVSDPVRHGDLLLAKKIVDEGRIGDTTFVRSRMGNRSALDDLESMKRYYEIDSSGGGAMIDMNYHNVHRIQWFLGKPVRCSAILVPFTSYGKEKNIDENSVAVYEFENGGIGVAETSWLVDGILKSFEVLGTKGIIRSDNAGFRYKIEDSDWIIVPKEDIPNEDIYPLRYWMECIRDDKSVEKYDVDSAVVYTEMIVAAYNSNRLSVPIEIR